ncbi:MAG TPA: dephospho-CoA kinase [Puia sp.]|nr:dephospho-CoA kinase [Puia sp.]
MLKVGLTGGIGSGKTTVAQIFEVLSIPVYYADSAARDLMNKDPELKKKIIASFGRDAYKNGELNRAYLGSVVFQDTEKLNLLNSIVHPITIRDSENWMKNQKASYAIKEAALIFEAGLEKYLDYVIGVTAPESLRMQRVVERDQVPMQKVLDRMRHQMDEKEKISRCDFVIQNDGIRPILPQVLEIHERLLKVWKYGSMEV